MAKDLKFATLIEVYSPILTDNQREMLEMYYFCDLSLAEIAENSGISRQGVRDSIKRGEAVIRELEDKLRFSSRLQSVERASEKIRECARDIVLLNNKYNYINEIEVAAGEILAALDTIEEQQTTGGI